MMDDEWRPFSQYLAAQHRKSTKYEYEWRCQQFLGYFDIKRPRDFARLTAADMITWIESLKERMKSPRVHAYAVKSMLEFYDHRDLSNKIPTPGGYVQLAPKWLPGKLVEAMVGMAPGPKLEAIGAVSYDLALRPGELVMMRKQASVDRPYVDVRTGNAKVYRLKTRQFPWQDRQLSPWAHRVLQKYERERRDGDPALFVGVRSQEALEQRELEREWHDFMEMLAYDADFKILRHSRLTQMAIDGTDIVDIARFAGHSSTMPTLIYAHIGTSFLTRPEMILEEVKGSLLYPAAEKLVAEYRARVVPREAR